MAFVYKGYEANIKVVQEQWLQLKIKFLLSYNIKIVIDGPLVGEDKYSVGNFSLMSQILPSGGIPPPPPSPHHPNREKSVW